MLEPDSLTFNREVYKYSDKVVLVIPSAIEQVIHDIKGVNIPAFVNISIFDIKIDLC